MNNQYDNQRYARQIALPNFGIQGQDALMKAKVLVIGTGGLGCPALQYLAISGVGTIGIVDDDVIELTNLHRQILFTEEDIGKPKARTAAGKLKNSNSKLNVQVYETKIHAGNALEIIRDYDVVIDGSDNFPTRYLVNDACALLKIPLVYGSVFRYEGQVSVFNSPHHEFDGRSANYRDLFPIPPDRGEVPNCLESGVLGVLTGIIGTMQASEAIKLITGIGDVLAWKVLTYDLLANSMIQFEFVAHPNALLAAPMSEYELSQMQYDSICELISDVQEITWENLKELYSDETILLLDVRNYDELPKLENYPYKQIPMNQLKDRIDELEAGKTIVVFCQTGKRSRSVIQELRRSLNLHNVLSIQGGITALEHLLFTQS